MKFTCCLLFLVVVCLCVLDFANAGVFGKSKEEKEKEKRDEQFMDGMAKLGEDMKDPAYLKHTMDSLNDPNVREEVKKMMADPDFRGKIEKLKKDPKFMENMADAKKVMESEAYVEAEPQVPPDYSDQKRNVEVGLKGLGEMSKDPKLLAEAMESLKDPEIAKEVQKMMADPEFQAEMKKLTDSPQFKKMQEKSEDVMEGLEQDPVKLKMLQKQMEEMMGK